MRNATLTIETGFGAVLVALGLGACVLEEAPELGEEAKASIWSQRNAIDDHRARLFADYASRRGEYDLCEAWNELTCSAQGAFLTITDRLGIATITESGTTPLDEVTKLYSIMGQDGSSCGGGDYNRLWFSVTPSLRDAWWEIFQYGWDHLILDNNGNYDWQRSTDIAGPHDPFNASNQTSYGHPRGQSHFWWDDQGASTWVCRSDLDQIGCVRDLYLVEMDQDYDWKHSSSTECSYGGRTGRQMYADSHPGVRYGWRPGGCDPVPCYEALPTGWVSASPNPCTVGSGESMCSTTVSWSTSNAWDPCVFVNGQLFACGDSGSQQAPWIQPGQSYEFELHHGASLEGRLLDTVTVTASSGGSGGSGGGSTCGERYESCYSGADCCSGYCYYGSYCL